MVEESKRVRLIFYTLLMANLGLLGYLLVDDYALDAAPEAVAQSSSSHGVVGALVLLAELGESPASSIGAVSGRADVEQGGVSSRSLCTLVGAFSTRDNAARFTNKLAALGVESKVKNLLVSSTVGFWLHLPPQPSRKEVLRRLSELQRQGVDSYIIPDGDLANGISLGMFSDRSRAETLKKKISGLGYGPEILSVPREKRELWVFLSQSESLKISTDRWLDLLSGKDLLQKQQNLCSDVASG